MHESFPLYWPMGYQRTSNRVESKFKKTMGQVQDILHAELHRLGAKNIVVSTNIRLQKNGLMYAMDMARTIDDPGVAVYFKYKEKDVVMCCDKYRRVWENVYAIGRSLEAIRQIARDGVSDFIKKTFTGFTALPPAGTINQKSIWEIMGFSGIPNEASLHGHYRLLAQQRHPDKPGGSVQAFQELNEAYEAAKKFFEKK